jgi:hypothetical protein
MLQKNTMVLHGQLEEIWEHYLKLILAGCGTQTAGLGFGGETISPAGQAINATEEYDGSAWAAGGNLNTASET